MTHSDYRDLCIEQLADDLAAMTEERESYRLLAQMAIAEMARASKENRQLRRRLRELNEARWTQRAAA